MENPAMAWVVCAIGAILGFMISRVTGSPVGWTLGGAVTGLVFGVIFNGPLVGPYPNSCGYSTYDEGRCGTCTSCLPSA